MILIVRGHINSGEAKYAISLWKMSESGSARPYVLIGTSSACRRRSLLIFAGSTGRTSVGSNVVSVTLAW